MSTRSRSLPFLICLVCSPFSAAAETLEPGVVLFQDYCAQCHGEDGRGGGQLVELRPEPLPDLRTLTKRNGGAFPFERIVETVNGSVELDMHGERYMPAWGEVFRFKEDLGDAVAHARILNLVWYLNKIQDD